jgi:hypothetical protein
VTFFTKGNPGLSARSGSPVELIVVLKAKAAMKIENKTAKTLAQNAETP